MKKLLSLLSVLTIGGTAVPTIIAASPYLKSNKINLESNLKSLRRTKREENNFNFEIGAYYLNGENYVYKFNLPYPVTTMYTFTKDEYGRKIGDIYFGTTNGIYLRKTGETTTTKIDGIDGEVKLIYFHDDGFNSVHVVTKTNKNENNLYYLNGENYVNKENNPPNPVTSMYWLEKDEYGRKIGDIYFGTTNGIYLRKTGETTTTKIDGIDGEVKLIYFHDDGFNSVHVVTKTNKNENNLYYLNGENYVYKFNLPYPVTTIYTFTKDEYGRKIGDIYFGTTNGIYLRKTGETTTTKIDGIDGEVKLIYFHDDGFNSVHVVTKTNKNENNLYYLNGENYVNKENNPPNPVTSMYWLEKDEYGRKIGDIYFGTTNGIYLRKTGELIASKINGTDGEVKIIYAASDNIYFLKKENNFTQIILNSNLGQINDNSNDVILNELNYLNHDLDISQLEIINRTNNSANVKIKNNLSNNIINVKYSINNEENKIIDLNELIKKAVFFKYRDENTQLKFKEIKDIDINNLKFTNVEVTKKENSFLKHRDIKNTCSNKEFINNTSNVKSFNIPACVYNSKYKLTFQILTGLTKKNEENKLNGWNINSDDEMRLSDFVSPNYNENNEIVNELSNNFDLSNTNKQEQEMIIYYLNDSADKFNVNPNEKLQINYSSLKTTKYKNMLNLKQKIIGTINAKIINYSDKEQIVTLSIKEAMQILQKYSLLPDEISINEDNNIIFNGKASILSEIEGQIKSNIVFSII